ncbi:hypothetical protein V2J09_004163 [Rumex salicifolius]
MNRRGFGFGSGRSDFCTLHPNRVLAPKNTLCLSFAQIPLLINFPYESHSSAEQLNPTERKTMVYLHQQLPSRKRPSSFKPPFPPPKTLKSTARHAVAPSSAASAGDGSVEVSVILQRDGMQLDSSLASNKVDRMVTVLADAGCTLVNPHGPPCLPSDCLKFRRSLDSAFTSDSALRSDFLQGFSSYVQSAPNLRRVLISSSNDGLNTRNDSLVRNLLLVPSFQTDLQNMLLEKLPEYIVADSGSLVLSMSLEDDIARLILNQFRWLDFLVDPSDFTDKLLQVLSIFPLHLKKEIIGSLPEMIGNENNKVVISSLELMLQEDPSLIVPVLDSFSNLNLDDEMDDQVITIALSCIRTVDADFMPYLLRFLLLSATPLNVRRIISQIREQLKFVCISNVHTTRHNIMHKGKALLDNGEASILDALRSSLRFKNILCEEILKEIKSLERAQDHKVIDIWLLVLLHMNGESLRKSVEKIFRKKVVEGCITSSMLEQCIHGGNHLVKDYFSSFLSVSEHLLGCKELKVRDFGSHLYICMFEEIKDAYSRQEVLGSLLTHIGSGPSFVVDSALDTLLLLASNHAHELVSLSAHINGGFLISWRVSVLNIYTRFQSYSSNAYVAEEGEIYQFFCVLTFPTQSSVDSTRSPFANELFMILRKQVSNPDVKYKKMGIIGTLKVVSSMGDATEISTHMHQKSNSEEAIELLRSCYDSCNQMPLQLALFYDEISVILSCKMLDSTLMEWIEKYMCDFESIFTSDLEGGKLAGSHLSYNTAGELWMNLDGDISPICVNILPLVSSSSRCSSLLQTLPANFLLISMTERLANQGLLTGIDALLGCPLHLPSSKYFGVSWNSWTGNQKETICLSLYYACNWLRELLNVFSTQVVGKFECTSQTLKEEIANKLIRRLRNLVFLESLLNYALKQYTFSLPDIFLHVEQNGSVSLTQPSKRLQNKDGHKKSNKNNSLSSCGKGRKAFKNMDTDQRFSQPTIVDVLNKAGCTMGKTVSNNDSSSLSQNCGIPNTPESHNLNHEDIILLDVGGVATALESQRSKFRPLSLDCLTVTSFMKNVGSCCPDSAAELPLHSYLLHDLIHKIDSFKPPSKQPSTQYLSCTAGLPRAKVNELLSNIKPFLVKLRKNFDAALSILQAGGETCQEHWKVESSLAAHPELVGMEISVISVSGSVFQETLSFFYKVLMLPETWSNKSFLVELFEAFQSADMSDGILSDMQPSPLPGTIGYLYCGAYSFLEGILDTVSSISFKFASEVLLTIKAVLCSGQIFLSHSVEVNGKNSDISCMSMLSILQMGLGNLACKLLKYNWDDCDLSHNWKSQSEIVEKILVMYLENNRSTSDALEELACSVFPRVAENKKVGEDAYHGFPTLCSATFLVWYRTLHEKNLLMLNKLGRDVLSLEKQKDGAQPKTVEEILVKLSQSVNALVSLVNLCRTYDKVMVHALAVKHGGKFVDSFLKAHFGERRELIVQMVKELQKATRILQTLCSEAKGSKKTVITSKIPATKRSMERLLFHVKGLLHTSASGCSFWMGNLKHKDLSGQVVSSQVYVDQDDTERDLEEADMEEEPCTDASKDQLAE